MGGTKPGRNELCPCGSSKKFKRCHGGPNVNYEEMISRGAEDAQRKAEIHWIQQQRQQGLGRPIIAAQTAGKRIVAVGHRLFQGTWPTFHDFLYSYILDVLGRDWFEAQTQLEQNELHPVIQWHERFLLASKAANLAAGETRQTLMTGAISAFMTLAYDLYTLEHNNDQTRTTQLRKSLIGRLKCQDQFIGVRYEIRVAAMLLRAGFELEWEDETDRRTRHVEYTATYPCTGKAFGVECKIRNQHAAKQANQHLGRFAGLVSDALKKATPHDRLIFVDLNTQAYPYVPGGPHDWRTIGINTLRKFEAQPKAATLPPAVVFITNYPDHHHLDTQVPDAGATVEGFKIDDYRTGQFLTLPQKIEMRVRNPEVEALVASIQEHIDLPSTFEGEIPGLQSNRLLIGHRYQMDDGVVGTLEDACVMNDNGEVALIIDRDEGGRAIYTNQLSPEEFAAWKRYPETFFGQIRQAPSPINDPIELYDRLKATYVRTPKEKLLQFMGEHGDRFAALTQPELLDVYVQGMVNSVMERAGEQEVPVHIQRMKPPPPRAV
ncbi:SEC-C domain-containing protein [Xanthomonas campestris pv. campestris]|uniref:YecA family protein n=1 Tax=Xanthomonas campestris TaxID=339 RepID=UPI00388E9708